MKLFLQKKCKIFERWGLRPQTPVPPAAGGFAPKPPASGSWGLRPQTPIGLRRLGAPPPDPKTAPPIANFWLRAWLYCIVITFIHQVALARRQRRDLSVFKSSCHLPTYLTHTVEASHCPFNCWMSSRGAVNTKFYSLWFDATGNRTPVYRFSSRR